LANVFREGEGIPMASVDEYRNAKQAWEELDRLNKIKVLNTLHAHYAEFYAHVLPHFDEVIKFEMKLLG
jgi:hypothetical protein